MCKKPATGLFLALFLSLFFQINSYPETLPTIPLFPCDFYGEETTSGILKVGAVVTVKDSQGNVIGTFTVKESSKYGLLTCKADDPATPEDEGALDGETVTFYVDGTQRGQAAFQSGKTYRVNLPAGSQNLPIQPPDNSIPSGGWGWGSYPVVQPDPGSKLLFPDGTGLTLIALPLLPKDSDFDKVFTEYTKNSPKDFWEFVPSDTTDPWRHYHPWYKDYRDLTQMGMGKAYWISKDTASDLWFFGDPYTQNITFNLKKGWNPIGWPYLYDKPVGQALSGLAFGTDCLYVARFNNLSQKFEYFSNSTDSDDFESFQPCRGYYIYMLKDKTITVNNPSTSARQPAFSINDTASYTSSASVVLTFSVANNLTASGADNSDKGIRRMLLSNDNTNWSEPLSYFYFNPYLRTTPWTLTSGDGTKTVYARFLDKDDNIVALAQDSIVLDTDNSGGSWPFSVNSYANAVVKSSPVAADIDANSSLEVVFGTQEGSVCCIDKKGQVVWTYDTGAKTGFSSSAALADLDGDNKLEVLIGRDISNSGSFYCLNNNGSLRWEYKAGSNIGFFSSPVAADLNADDTVEILTTAGKSVYCLNKNGGLNWKYDTGGQIYHSSPAIADIDGDNNLEVFAGSDSKYLYCLNKSGSLVWRYNTAGSIQTAPVIADLNRDGDLKVITGSGSHIYCLNKSGQLKWHYNIGTGFNVTDFAVADVNNDNKLEILTACGYNLYCFNKDGGLLWQYKTGGWVFFGSPAVADLDANNSLEILISSADNALYCLNGSGVLVWKRQRAHVSSSFAIADLDGNGSLEILFGTRYGNLCCVDKNGNDFVPSGSGTINALAWPMFQHDCQHTGLYDSTPPTTPVVTDEGETTESLKQLYASWASSDKESSILKYEYKIMEGSKTGAVVRDWTSTGTFNYVTAALNLTNGRAYFFGVKAKNNTLWSQVGYSDGITVKIYVDTTAPNINISAPINNSVTESSTIPVSGTVDDKEAIVSVNGQLAVLSGTSFSVSGMSLSEGENTIVVTATDKAGNTGMAFVKVTYKPNIPCAEPSIDFTNSPTNINRQVITGRKAVDVTEVNVSCATASAGAVSFPTGLTWKCEMTNLREGENIISVSAKNKCGNTSLAVTTSITLDTTGPRLNPIARVIDERTIEITYDSGVFGGAIDANYSISPDIGTISARHKEGSTFILTTAGQSVIGVNYRIIAENITDLLGNPIDFNSNFAIFTGITNVTSNSPALLAVLRAEEEELHAQLKFGQAIAPGGDVNGDGFPDILVGGAGSSLGAHVYFGGPGMDEITDIFLTREKEARDYFGYSIASAGDVNADGYVDIIVGAHCSDTGKAYIYFGGPQIDGVADLILSGEKEWKYFGYSVSGAGDYNNDGYDDIVVGSPCESFFDEEGLGEVYIYFGGPSLDSQADIVLEGKETGDYFGCSLASAKDINGDGFPDIVVGASCGGVSGSDGPGKVYIYFGGPQADNQADMVLEGEEERSNFGHVVSCSGDVNGDGFLDIIVSAPGADDGGKVYIYFGGPSMDSIADITMTAENQNSGFGRSLAYAGDINKDGFSDVIVGAPLFYFDEKDEYQKKISGKAYVYFGGPSMDSSADLTISKMVDWFENSYLGCAVASAGDINGDGFNEFLVGSEINDGEVYVYTMASMPPRLSPTANVIDKNNVEVSYSEEVKGADFSGNYSITPDLGTISVSSIGCNIYRLTTASSHTPGQSYTIGVAGITDTAGAALDKNHSEASFIGYNTASVPSVDSFQVFDLETKDANYTDSSIVGVTLKESDPDGRIAGWLINESAQKPAVSDFVLTTRPAKYVITGPDGKRPIYAWVKDVDGNVSNLSDNSQAEITLDTTAPQIKITYPVEDSLFSSAVVDVKGTISDTTPVKVMVNGTEAEINGTEFSLKGAALYQGTNIIIAAAEDLLGHTSADNVVVVVDTTAPSKPVIMDDGNFTEFSGELRASWSCTDLESGIAEYKYAIGTTPGGKDILGWTSAGTNTQVTRSDLALKDGKTYYFTVKAVNGVGLESEPGISDGIEISLAVVRAWIVNPCHNETLFNNTTVKVNVFSSIGAAGVYFYLDDGLKEIDSFSPYEWEWDVKQASSGRHTLKVIAYDIKGNMAVDQVLIDVAEEDKLPPRVLSHANVIDDNTVEITYTEPVIGALSPENYSIAPALAVIEVIDAGDNTYRLVTDKHAYGKAYTISVSSNITDLSGNIINSAHNSAAFVGGVEGPLALVAFLQGGEKSKEFGYSVASAGNINGDRYDDIVVGTGWTSKVYVYFGGLIMDDTPDLILGDGSGSSNFGRSVAGVGDVNADGYSDIIIGGTGAAGVYFGGFRMDDKVDLVLRGEEDSHSAYSVAFAGDVNGDGFNDVIVGAENEGAAGSAYLFFGGPQMDEVFDIVMTGESRGGEFGCSVASAGDVNADGFDDVVIGAANAHTSKDNYSGKTYIYFGGSSMDNVADIVMEAEDYQDNFGCSVSSAGDMNADGYDDVIIGADWAYSGNGRAYIYFGGPSMDNVADIVITGENRYEELGGSVASLGDINIDGYDDVIVGAINARNSADQRVGKAYIYFGGPSVDNIADLTMTGEQYLDSFFGITFTDEFGCSVASAGDVNGDGINEIIVGDNYFLGKDGQEHAGGAYVYSLGLALPKLDPKANAVDAYNVDISYNYDLKGALLPQNYSISPDLGEITVSDRGNQAYRLTTSVAQTAGQHYIISVKGVVNTIGTPLAKGCDRAEFYGQDSTPPSVPVVTDEGRRTSLRDSLYMRWSSQDAESQITEYQYAIGSSFDENGELVRDILDWTSAGTKTEITHRGLNLSYDKTYYVAVRAKNKLGLWSEAGFSDGITVSQASIKVTGEILPQGNSSQEGENMPVELEVDALKGETFEYQFLIDGEVKRAWGSSPKFNLDSTSAGFGAHTLEIQIRSSGGRMSLEKREIYIFRKAIKP